MTTKAFSVGAKTASQMQAGVILPQSFVRYKIKSLWLVPALYSQPYKLVVKDGAGVPLFANAIAATDSPGGSSSAGTGFVQGVSFDTGGATGSLPQLAWLPDMWIDPTWTVTLYGTDALNSLTLVWESE